MRRHVRVNATKLDEMAVNYIPNLEIDRVVLDAVVSELREDECKAARKRDPELRALRDRKEALETHCA